jgi:hypothetical protein
VRRILIGLPIACLLLGLTPTHAGAATVRYAADGERCTIVGTSHADVLVGTSHHDVICGLGGNDVIHGGGGNDTIDGGSGNDTLYGGADNDLLLGGSGNDRLYGNAGNDRLYGGSGKNTLSGGGGKNTLSKTGNGPTPSTGSSGTCGASPAATKVAPAAVCTPDIPPVDTAAPVIVSATTTPSTVDVSNSDQTVTVSVHVTDDTAAVEVRGFGDGLHPADSSPIDQAYGTLTSGTARDGIWTLSMIVYQGTAAGFGNLTLVTDDEFPHYVTKQFAGVTVVDTDPDTTAPVVSDLTLSSTQVDVRNAAVALTVTAQITDADSGVDPSSLPWVYLYPPTSYSTAAPLYSYWQRVSGTNRDGLYQLSYTLPQGTMGGTWSLVSSNSIHDRAGNTTGGPTGTVDVISTAPVAPPTVVGVTADQPKIDVCPTGADEQIDVHVQGADSAAAVEVDVTGPYGTFVTNAGLVSGTPADGIWRATFPFSSTTPPGDYSITTVKITDRGQTTTDGTTGSFTIVPAGAPTS